MTTGRWSWLALASILWLAPPAHGAAVDSNASGTGERFTVEAAGPTVPKITEQFGHIAILPIHGMIDDGLSYSIRRRVAAARQDGAGLILFDVDTFGGRLDSAFDITDFVSRLDGLKTVAYVAAQAISAGALFCVACDEIVMRKGTIMGDCQPIAIGGEKGYIELGEKYQSPLRAAFQKNAEAHGYPVLLCDAMVTLGREVLRVTWKDGRREYVERRDYDAWPAAKKEGVSDVKVIVRGDELLTMTDVQAHELGFSRVSVKDRDEAVALYLAPGGAPRVYAMTWSEQLVRWLNQPVLTGLLLIVGLVALYFSFKIPGMGLPEGLAIVCFALLFLSKYLVGLASAVDIAIFVLGVGLLAVEVFLIPGFGVTGISGIILIVVGLILMLQRFTIPENPFETGLMIRNFIFVAAVIAGSILGFLILARLVPAVPGARRIVLTATQKVEEGYIASRPENQALIGRQGVVRSTLRPAGKVDLNGELVDVVTQGEFISAGDRVQVIAVEGNRVVVARV